MSIKVNNPKKIIERLTALEVLMQDTRNDIKDIKENHIRKIYDKLDSQKTWLIGVLIMVIMTLLGTIINFLK